MTPEESNLRPAQASGLPDDGIGDGIVKSPASGNIDRLFPASRATPDVDVMEKDRNQAVGLIPERGGGTGAPPHCLDLAEVAFHVLSLPA